MPADDSNPSEGQESSGKERYIETAAKNVDDFAHYASVFIEGLEHDEATEENLLRLHQRFVVAAMSLQDAATVSGVIDDEDPRHRATEATLNAVGDTTTAARSESRTNGVVPVAKAYDAIANAENWLLEAYGNVSSMGDSDYADVRPSNVHASVDGKIGRWEVGEDDFETITSCVDVAHGEVIFSFEGEGRSARAGLSVNFTPTRGRKLGEALIEAAEEVEGSR